MPLSSTTFIGPYEIASLIGAGGMGEVYKARDSRLNRDVAIKVLPASFAADRERLRRFQQEAQSVAALSHPNILAIYDTGLHNDAPYLVSELLEGESLRDLLSSGIPSHRKSVNYAIQIAQGLAAAHSKGIAHRDLKPENIFITREGQVKILDFGLAKAVTGSHDATVAAPGSATDAGIVMGTAGYMSPEQVRGGAVDTRTDIFSFGAVFYEMLIGVRAFKRDTTAETMTAILHDEPPELLEPSRQIPPALDRIVRHCLEKSPDQRFQSARDLAFDLESASNLTPSAGLRAAKSRPHYARWGYAIAAVLAVITALVVWRMVSSTKPVTGSQFHQLTFRRGVLDDARFTPDGQSVIYTAAWEGASPEIYSESATGSGGQFLRDSNARLLAVSKQGEIAVALNPRRIPYFFVQPGTLARSNGSSAPRPEIENVWAADYNPNNSDLAVVRYLPDRLSTQLEYPVGHVLFSAPYIGDLRFSPNGRYLAFTSHTDCCDDRGTVVIVRTDGEKIATSAFYDSVEGLAWAPSGDEVWFTSPLESGQIHALSLSGKNRQVLSVPGRLFLHDIAANGQLLVQQGITRRGIIASTGGTQHDLSWLDYGYLRAISSDGKMVLFEEEGLQSKNYGVFVRATDGSPAVQIGDGYGMALSPDKSWAITQRFATPANEIWLVPVGPGEARRLSVPGFVSAQFTAASFTFDGKSVIYDGALGGKPPRTWFQDLSGGPARPISPENIIGFGVSPDGKWLLAGHTDQSGINLLVPMSGGAPFAIPGLKPGESGLGWTSDNRLYVSTFPGPGEAGGHIEKLDPRTGARTAWRDIPYPSIVGGITVLPPLITPDGNSYAFGYRQTVNDLYTISAPR